MATRVAPYYAIGRHLRCLGSGFVCSKKGGEAPILVLNTDLDGTTGIKSSPSFTISITVLRLSPDYHSFNS